MDRSHVQPLEAGASRSSEWNPLSKHLASLRSMNEALMRVVCSIRVKLELEPGENRMSYRVA